MKKIRYYLSGVTRDGKAVLCFLTAVVLSIGIFGIGRAGIGSLVTDDAQIRLCAWIVFAGAGVLILASLFVKMWQRRFGVADFIAQTLFYTSLAACADLAVFHGTEIFVPLLIAAVVAFALSLTVLIVRVVRVDPQNEVLEIVTGKPNLLTYTAQLFRGGSLAFSIAGAVAVAAFVSVYLRKDFFADIKTDAVLKIASLVILCVIGAALLVALVRRFVTKRICLTDGLFFTLTLAVLLSLYPVLSTLTTMRIVIASVSVGVCLIAEIALIATARLSQYVQAESKGMRAYTKTFFERVPVLLVTAVALVAFFLVVRADEVGLWARLLDTPLRLAAVIGGAASLCLLCFAIGATARTFGTFDSLTLFVDEFALLMLARCLAFETSPAAYASFAVLATLGVLLTLFRMGNAYVPGFRVVPKAEVIELESHAAQDADEAPPAVFADDPTADAEESGPEETLPTESAQEEGEQTPSAEPVPAPNYNRPEPDAPQTESAFPPSASEDGSDASELDERNDPTERSDDFVEESDEQNDEAEPLDGRFASTAPDENAEDEIDDESSEEDSAAPLKQARFADDGEASNEAIRTRPFGTELPFAQSTYPAKKSYTVALRTLPDETKLLYSELKNELLRYRLRDRISARKEDFNRTGKSYSRLSPERKIRTQARITVRGRTLRLYLNLDPETLDAARYHHRDVSGAQRFADLPTMMRVTSRRMADRALELIAYLAGKEGFEAKKNYRPVDFTVGIAREGLTEFERNGYGYLIGSVATLQDAADKTELAPKAIEIDATLAHAERTIRSTLTTDDLERYAKFGVVNLEILREAGAVQPNCNYLSVVEGTRLGTRLSVRANAYTPAAALLIALAGGDAILETEREPS